MNIWAIADLHLCKGVPEKNMEIFGDAWSNYMDRMAENWKKVVQDDDLVLLAGDISWAMKLEHAALDLDWIDALPGTKVMIRGNHDYWWSSASKVRSILPPSLHIIQNDVFNWEGISIAGARFWDTPEFNFIHCFAESFPPLPIDEKIYKRELGRLEMSLKQLDQSAKCRIAMTHYPPIGTDLKPSAVSALLEEYNVQSCVFGHLHNIKEEAAQFGKKDGVDYIFVAADFLEFMPKKILSV